MMKMTAINKKNRPTSGLKVKLLKPNNPQPNQMTMMSQCPRLNRMKIGTTVHLKTELSHKKGTTMWTITKSLLMVKSPICLVMNLKRSMHRKPLTWVSLKTFNFSVVYAKFTNRLIIYFILHNRYLADSKSDTDEKPGARALHKTSSIFLRNLAPTITKSEVEAMCKRYNGFLRVAIADPLVERRWFRRGWVTFKRDTNIKEICWNLNNIRLRDCELGAIVNRDLSRRVRPVNGITAHKTIVRSDIKLCAKIAHNLDQKANLWIDDNTDNSSNGNQTSFGLNSNNPVLQNITDYLIEEASAEEEELLGLSSSENKDAEGETLERDAQLINVLDKLILYMRIVHSVDFYNHCEYPYEDEMPNRCGIIHARGPPPQNKVTSNEIQEYTRNFEGKMSSFLTKSVPIADTELQKLGCKDIDSEVEKFVQANTQELAKDKWLCPLSGKKFKGPEFIRKHIFNKHGEKVEEVKKEVEYFNNYLKDPKRPQLPEHPGNTKKPAVEAQPPPT